MRVTLGGAEVDLLDRGDLLAAIRDRLGAEDPRPLVVAPAGLEHLYHFGIDSGREGALDQAKKHADWMVVPADRLLAYTARRLTARRWERTPTRQVIEDALAAAERSRARLGVVAADPAQAQALAVQLSGRLRHAGLAGVWAPPADGAAASALAEQVRAARVDLLLVGLGSPQGEEWLLRHVAGSGVRVAVTTPRPAALLRGRDGAGGAGTAARLARRLLRAPGALLRLLTQSRAEPDAADEATPVLVSPARWQARFGKVLVAMDAVVIGLSSLLAYLLREALGRIEALHPFANEVPAAIAVLPLWLAILAAFGCYKPHYLNAGAEGLRRFAAGTAGGLLALGFVSFLFNLQLSRVYVAILSALVLLLGGAGRILLREYLRRQRDRGRYTQNVLVVGADDEAIQVAEAMLRSTTAGYRVLGFLDDERPVGEAVGPGLEILGRPSEVLDLAFDMRAGLVVVSPTAVKPGTLREITLSLEGSPVDVAIAPSLFEVMTHRVTVESVSNVPILHVDQVRLEGVRRASKRALDLAGAGLLLLLFSPVMAVTALSVRLANSGPVLFRQTRVGRDGIPFTLLKFRTMVADAEERLTQVADLNEVGHHFFKIRHDPRVTRVGRFLRKWSLDETPQLWNILRGDMSLVGPRPPLPLEVEKYEPWHLRRLRVRPGLTGLWQVSGRSNVPFDEAVRLDLFYIENWSVGFDLFILAKTVVAVLGGSGAY